METEDPRLEPNDSRQNGRFEDDEGWGGKRTTERQEDNTQVLGSGLSI